MSNHKNNIGLREMYFTANAVVFRKLSKEAKQNNTSIARLISDIVTEHFNTQVLPEENNGNDVVRRPVPRATTR